MSEREETQRRWEEPSDVYRPPTDEELRRLYSFEEPEREYRPVHPEPAWKSVLRRLWAPIAAFGFLVWKFKFAVFAIFKFKLFTVAGSMLVSIAAYALLWGWKFAVGFVLLLLVHELGHVLELRSSARSWGSSGFRTTCGRRRRSPSPGRSSARSEPPSCGATPRRPTRSC